MPTGADHAALAPHLAASRAARTALALAGQTADNARDHVADLKRNTRSWDRFWNRDSAVGLAYREAKRARKAAEAARTARRRAVEDLDRLLDRCIEPMMVRLDPGWVAAALVGEKCAHAQQLSRDLRSPLRSLLTTVHAATKSGSDEKAVEAARSRYRYQLTQVRAAARSLKTAVDAVTRADRGKQRVEWNSAILDRLPRTADDIKTLTRLSRELDRLPARLDHLRSALKRRQTGAEADRRRMLVRTRQRLIAEDS